MRRLVAKASECVKEGITCDAPAHQAQFKVLGEENAKRAPANRLAPALARFITERTPFPQRPSFPSISDGITAQLPTAPQPSEVETPFDFGDLAIATTAARRELGIRGGHPSLPVDSYMHSFMRAPHSSFIRTFRGSWRPSIKRLGLVGRSGGIVILLSGIPAHACLASAFDLDDSPVCMLQDCSDVKEFRGSLHCAQRRISAREVLVNGSSAPIPVGLLVQSLFGTIVSSNDSDPRLISSMLDASQCMGDPGSLRDDQNLAFALKVFLGEPQPFGQLSDPQPVIGPKSRPLF